jgi:hypothetical protein
VAARLVWGAASTSDRCCHRRSRAVVRAADRMQSMLRSFCRAAHVDPGFDPTNILTFTAFNPRLRGNDERPRTRTH